MTGVESAALSVLGWVASPAIKDLYDRGKAYLGRDITKELEDLDTILLPQLKLTIEAAQNSPNADVLKKWLALLKNAYYDAETILHELEYEHLRRKVEGNKNLHLKVIEKLSLKQSLKQKLWKRLNKLKEVAAQANDFRDLASIQTIGHANNASSDGSHTKVTTAHALPDKVFGRDEVRDQIIDFLFKDQAAGSSKRVVAITGVGGAGKTTLAQFVYHDERVVHGALRMWLCLSHQNNIDIMVRTKEMMECAFGEKCPDGLTSPTALQNKLIENLSDSKSVLLVLDDVLYDKKSKTEQNQQWDTLLAPLIHFLGGRLKIVITSRSNYFPGALNPGKHVSLEDLAYADFQNLFMYHALRGLENDTKWQQLRDIGDQIAQKMTRSPLAAKVVGNELHECPDVRYWQDTLHNIDMTDVTEVLRWSYEHLDAQLRRCFLFLAVLPKGAGYSATQMVRYWVALDFIHDTSDNNRRSVEDIGLEYFNKMVANSILKFVGGWYRMHDLYHDLAVKLSAEDCFRVTDSEKAIPKDTAVLHMFLKVDNENPKEKLRTIPELPNLRTLILGNEHIEDEDMSEILSIISRKFKNLRILELCSRVHRTLPTTVGGLRNLRCLCSGLTSLMEELPDSVSQLYHLQFLILPGSLKSLPVKLSNLTKLRHIVRSTKANDQLYLLPPVPYLSKLTSLQYLDEFQVRKEEGYEVGQLGSLREIRGFLGIVGLENVRDKGEALEAKLIDKPKLEWLKLVWGQPAESGSEKDVIEALQPNENLQLLTIDGYSGSSYPTWLKGSFLRNLTEVCFDNCNALSRLPPNFHQFRYCSALLLQNLGAFTELSSLPQNLTWLTISDCPSLIVVGENELQVDTNGVGVIMEGVLSRILVDSAVCEFLQRVLDVDIKSFVQTGSLENYREQLQIIQNAHPEAACQSDCFILNTRFTKEVNRAWWSCHQQRMDFIFSSSSTRANKLKLPLGLRILHLVHCCISDGALSDCMRGMAALEELHLRGVMSITTLPSLSSLEKLRILKISDCWCLRSLDGLHALPQLQEVDVRDCFLVETAGARLPPSLRSFSIAHCTLDVNILSSNLPCLQTVSIKNCSVSSSLSFGQLTSLKKLIIRCCFNLSFTLVLEAPPFIDTLVLTHLPNLDVESLVQCFRGCRFLQLSSPVVLNKLLSSQDFLPPKILWMHYWEEPITFEKSDHLASIKFLGFVTCKTKNLPTSLTGFSALEAITIRDCPEISELPVLPDSVQYIEIRGCPVLKERCQPNGADWHKIQRIQEMWIE